MPVIKGSLWLNSEPLTQDDLRERVVLVDFWTYSCVNCLRTLPYLKDWWLRYKDKGLVIIGVHTPEFAFEKDTENLRKAVADLKVEWPVVADNDYVNWNAFANRYWPAKYLVNREGEIVYTHFGEGAYEQTEKAIRSLLEETGEVVMAEEHGHGKVCFSPTPELYCGYYRGRVVNSGGYQKEREGVYEEQHEIPEDSVALSGRFYAAGEYVESREEGAELQVRFRATEVNLVLEPAGEKAEVEVRYEEAVPKEEERGADTGLDGVIEVSSPRMYQLFRPGQLQEGVLRIRAKKGSFRAYAFTFSGCV